MMYDVVVRDLIQHTKGTMYNPVICNEVTMEVPHANKHVWFDGLRRQIPLFHSRFEERQVQVARFKIWPENHLLMVSVPFLLSIKHRNAVCWSLSFLRWNFGVMNQSYKGWGFVFFLWNSSSAQPLSLEMTF